ncbi:MAG: hypothetical protein EOM20_21860, partial [Spartobacteria bacterium]|nr:hypothetical protein [Spartobacteria bacterium]
GAVPDVNDSFAGGTVVYVGNRRLILKPANLPEARENLKLLMSRPQWVYSGIALVQASTGKTLLDYERTRVFMHPLTDQEIDAYHQRVCPLDKAGGFDIEGLGSLFIRRVEGCYTNVIGLPMAKLRLMLKKFGITTLCLVMAAGLTGCATEFNLAKNKQRTYLYGTEREQAIGASVARRIAAQSEFVTDVDVLDRVRRIVERLSAVTDSRHLVFQVRVIDDADEDEPVVNAFALPGGYIFVFKGLVDAAETDDQLAGVIAHEMAHVTARHGVERLQNSYTALLAQLASIHEGGNFAAGVNLAVTSLMTEYSQADEFEADELAARYMKGAGYDPREMINFLGIMKKQQDRKTRGFSYWRSHPYLTQRMANI